MSTAVVLKKIEGRMTKGELLERLTVAHTRLLMRRDFWYSRRLQEGDKVLVGLASDIRRIVRGGDEA